MRKIFYFMAMLASAAALTIACDPEESKEPETPEEPEVVAPEVEEATLTAKPTGDTLTFAIELEEAWEIYADDEYEWVIIDPMEGLGETEVTITLPGNTSGNNRAATFFVKSGEFDYYEIFISQAKMELPVVEGDYNFLKEIVEKGYLGEDTPEITDWYAFDGSGFPGITCEMNDVGRFQITRIDGAPLTGWPSETVLTALTWINVRGQAGLSGAELSPVWNTPKLEYLNMSLCNMTGVYPDELAANTPNLAQIFMDSNNFYGALPHIWATKKLEVAILVNYNNCRYKRDENGALVYDENGDKIITHAGAAETDSPYLGYILPATFDVIMNEDRVAQNDKTQMKVGGVCKGHWLGFEKGWGQARYEKYDENAVAGDTSVWSDKRLLVGNGDDYSWAWYYSNMGYEGEIYQEDIPRVMLDWNQADADAFTAWAKEQLGL